MPAEREEQTTYQVRLPKKLLQEFLAEAKSRDDNAASMIRKFMRYYTSRGKKAPWQHSRFSLDSLDDYN